MNRRDDLNVAEGIELLLRYYQDADAALIRAEITDEGILEVVAGLTALHRRAGELEDEVLMHRHARQTKLVRAALSDDLDAPNVVIFPGKERQQPFDHGDYTGGGAA